MKISGDFPGGLVVRNPLSNAGSVGSIPGWGTRIPHASHGKKKKKKSDAQKYILRARAAIS